MPQPFAGKWHSIYGYFGIIGLFFTILSQILGYLCEFHILLAIENGILMKPIHNCIKKLKKKISSSFEPTTSGFLEF